MVELDELVEAGFAVGSAAFGGEDLVGGGHFVGGGGVGPGVFGVVKGG